TSFVGRVAERAEIGALLTDVRLVTLTGVGGVGKTRLALEVAAEARPAFREVTGLSELAAADDGDAMAQVGAAALGVGQRPGLSLVASIVDFLRPKQLLVVLDNCEHLLDAASDLAGTVGKDCRHVCVIATSREPLEVPGEHVVRVRSLPVPDAAAVEWSTIEQSDCVRLFCERAASTGSTFALSGANARTVAEICRRLDGIPLAIELAAARIAVMQPVDIAARLDERFRLLTGRRRGALERHQTLRATVDWSYSLLDERERTVFKRLGVFPATFDADAAERIVTGDGVETWQVGDALVSLVAKSMLVIDESSEATTRYQMLETLRQYA